MSTANSKEVYHFTDTPRLSPIIETCELRPGTNRFGEYPQDFLWATTNPIGDRTSSAMSPAGLKLWRSGASQLIRFTLDAKDFGTFSEALRNCPEWTADQIARLKRSNAAMGGGDTNKWRCRSEPLPLTKVLRVEAKSFAAGRWVEIDVSPNRCVAFSNPDTRGVVIGQYCYSARQVTLDGNVGYDEITRHHLSTAAAA
jgi:hypothetical protein